MIPRIEPVRAVFPDRHERPKDDRGREPKQDTFQAALQDAQEQEDERKDRGGT
jgi:hypothetical protein